MNQVDASLHKVRPRLTFVVNPSSTEAVAEAVERFYDGHGRLFDLTMFSVTDVEEGRVSSRTYCEALRGADMVFLDLRGGGLATSLAGAALADGSQPVLVLVGGSLELMSLLRLRKFSFTALAERAAKTRSGASGSGSSGGRAVNLQRAKQVMWLVEKATGLLPVGRLRDARNWVRAVRYWTQGGSVNIKSLLEFMGREYLQFRLPRPAAPRELPEFGIYDPVADRFHHRLAEYQRRVGWDSEKPSVGLLFYGGMHFASSVVPARALFERLSDGGRMNVLPVFASPETNLKAIRRYFQPGGRPLIDVAVYLQWFQMTMFSGESPQQALALLRSLNVPWLNGAPMYSREIEQWRESVEGLSPIETMTAVIFPELDGVTEPIPVCGLEPVESPVTSSPVRRVAAIPENVDRVAGRAAAWSRLRRLDNDEKRLAVILYNYPPGEDNLAGAAYLDVFESIRRLLRILKQRGYAIGEVPGEGELPERFLREGLVNQPRWTAPDRASLSARSVPTSAYRRWLEEWPDAREVSEVWGEPPGGIMVGGEGLRLPFLEFGNVLIGLQPQRGYHGDPTKISHDKTVPPHHQYVAFYRWLASVWRPDAVLHVGTHGTLEFLPGKEVGSSDACWPGRLLGAVPHLYLYHVVNASEATIAKRRSLGTLVNYNSPAFTASGLYDQYAGLEELIAEAMESESLDPARAIRLKARVLEQAAAANLAGDSLDTIHEELARMKRSIIPDGLHRIGDSPSDEAQIAFANYLLRCDRPEAASLHRLLAEQSGEDYAALLQKPMQVGPDGKAVDRLAELDRRVTRLVEQALFAGRFPDDAAWRRSLEFARQTVACLDGSLEIENLLAGLAGGYVEPGLGGDPLRNPEVLPTGRNSFQFDPRLIPSDEAVRRGAEIAENTLRAYHRTHGEWPSGTGVILWGFETTKTRGETVGQVLAYFGVRIAAGANPWYKKLEAIPLAELGRPRVDCHIQICGFFRDMYANVVSLLNRAAELVAGLDEPDDRNFVRRHTWAAADRLGGGMPGSEATVAATARVYGPRPGEYGTRTVSLIETGAWQDEQQIADAFAASMNHLYADNLHGVRHADLFRGRLETVEVVSQVRDCHEYEIADLDHYYEFFGGLARTVQAVRGRAPEMLITDTTGPVIRTEPVGEALNRGVRTRLLNPKWIDGMLRHDYHGAQEIAERVQYLIGFAATTHAVQDWVFSAVHQRFIGDEAMFQRLTENNRFATEEIMKRLFEAEQRGYWKASDDELEMLRRRYLQWESWIEESFAP